MAHPDAVNIYIGVLPHSISSQTVDYPS